MHGAAQPPSNGCWDDTSQAQGPWGQAEGMRVGAVVRSNVSVSRAPQNYRAQSPERDANLGSQIGRIFLNQRHIVKLAECFEQIHQPQN